MTEPYGKSCSNHGNFYKLVEQFKNGQTSVTDEHHSGVCFNSRFGFLCVFFFRSSAGIEQYILL